MIYLILFVVAFVVGYRVTDWALNLWRRRQWRRQWLHTPYKAGFFSRCRFKGPEGRGFLWVAVSVSAFWGFIVGVAVYSFVGVSCG
jgi:hypothetical protein